MSLIPTTMLGTGGVAVPYSVPNSANFSLAASTKLQRTLGTPTNSNVWTVSFWMKRTVLSVGDQYVFVAIGSDADGLKLENDNINIVNTGVSSNISIAKYRDVSDFVNVIVSVDTGAGDKMQVFVDGELISLSGSDPSSWLNWNAATLHTIGAFQNSGLNSSLYLSDFYMIDGQALTTSDFGQFDANGKWQPIEYTGTYGNNGFYLNFSNASNLGEDSSGNGNHFTNTNVTQSNDTPTKNLAVLNPLFTGGGVSENVANGNLKYQPLGTNVHNAPVSTIGAFSNKFYVEANLIIGDAANGKQIGIIGDASFQTGAIDLSQYTPSTVFEWSSGVAVIKKDNVTTQSSLTIPVNNDVMGFEIDMIAKTIQFKINNTNVGTAEAFTGDIAFIGMSANVAANGCTFVFSENDWTHTAPSGFVELSAANIPDADVKPSDYYSTVLYTGNGSNGHAITGMGFQPDLLWTKGRNFANNHFVMNSISGVTKSLQTDTNSSEQTNNVISSFDSDGFTLTSNNAANNNGSNFVAWGWDAGTSAVSNTDGTITSTVSAGVNQGFSLVSYTGNGINGATVGHGLGTTPTMIIVKNRDNNASGWRVFHTKSTPGANPGANNLELNSTSGEGTYAGHIENPSNTTFEVTEVLSSLVSVNTNGDKYIAYCFADVNGFSKAGSYTGNGSTDGTFVYTGFKPSFVLYKRRNFPDSWRILDDARDPDNPNNAHLFPDLSATESIITNGGVDYVSNGFKLRGSDSGINASSVTYVYLAFAEYPFSR